MFTFVYNIVVCLDKRIPYCVFQKTELSADKTSMRSTIVLLPLYTTAQRQSSCTLQSTGKTRYHHTSVSCSSKVCSNTRILLARHIILDVRHVLLLPTCFALIQYNAYRIRSKIDLQPRLHQRNMLPGNMLLVAVNKIVEWTSNMLRVTSNLLLATCCAGINASLVNK